MAVGSWPELFAAKQMGVTDGTQYVRVGGNGPAVLLLHGFGDTGDMWVPLAATLVKDHAVIVPDLRGMGLSSHPEGGYEKVAQARDLAAILDQLGSRKIALVTHDIGNMVGYALAALFPQRVSRWVAMDAPLPGIGHWDDLVKKSEGVAFQLSRPRRRAAGGRTRAHLCSIASTTSFRPTHRSIDEQTRDHYAALYARPNAIHNAFGGQFAAFAQDAIDNQTTRRQGQTEDAGAGDRRRSYLRNPSRHRNRICRRQCTRCSHRGSLLLDHGGATRAGNRCHPLVPQGPMID